MISPAPLRALALVALAYVVAAALAYVAVTQLSGAHPFVTLIVANLVATVVVFAFSRAYDNSSFYDAYWSVAPMLGALYLQLGPYLMVGISVRKWLAIALIWLWGGRLTFNWLRGWQGLGHEDWRYVDFRQPWGKAYWPLSFLGIHLFPTICTLAGSLALIPIMSSSEPMHALDAIGAVVVLAAIAIESTADAQLHDFRKTAEAKTGAICDVGLWRYSRHPNYFGEVSFWVGLWVLGVAADPAAAWWTAVGPLLMVTLFWFVSIPMMEKRAVKRRPGFAAHQRKVSKLVPWFRSSG